MIQLKNRLKVWFNVLEEMGQDPKISYLFLTKDGPTDWQELNHRDYDGIGLILNCYKKRQETINYPVFYRKNPSLKQKVLSLKYYGPESKLRHTQWKDFDRSVEGSFNTHLSFTPEEFKRLKEMAKENRGTIQTYCLQKLDRLVNGYFQPTGEERWWMIPVNMRGEKEKERIENYSSYIGLQLNDDMSPRGIQLMMIDKLRKWTHWASWFYMWLFSFLGKGFIKKILSYYEDNQHGWTGIYTYIEYETSSPDLIIGIAPVTNAHPIGVNVMRVNKDNLAIGIKMRAGLVKGQKVLNKFADDFKNELLGK